MLTRTLLRVLLLAITSILSTPEGTTNRDATSCNSWNRIGHDKKYSVVLVNHRPHHCRIVSLRERWHNAQLLVVHDTETERGYDWASLDGERWQYIEDTGLMPYTRLYKGGSVGADAAFAKAAAIFRTVQILRRDAAAAQTTDDQLSDTRLEVRTIASDILTAVLRVNAQSKVKGKFDGEKGTVPFVVDGVTHELVLDITGTQEGRATNKIDTKLLCATLNMSGRDCDVLLRAGEQFVATAVENRRRHGPTNRRYEESGTIETQISSAIPILATHLSILLSAVSATVGDVLELGTDVLSTPAVHEWLQRQGTRHATSVDSDFDYMQQFVETWNLRHQYHHVEVSEAHESRGGGVRDVHKKRNDVCVVIPCVPVHVHHLSHVLSSVSEQTVLPVKIVVALSEADHATCQAIAAEYTHVTFSCTDKIANPAANRNRGALQCGPVELISFIDADDAMLPTRLDRVADLFDQFSADAVLHSYRDRSLEREIMLLDADDLRRLHHKQNTASADQQEWSPLNVHGLIHSHITVKWSMFLKQTYASDEKYRFKEDSEYVRRLIDTGANVVYTSECLSTYRNHLSSQWYSQYM